MYYAGIKYVSIANGPGSRTAFFVSGCTHHCKGCFNAETWDFHYGDPYTQEVEDALVESIRPSYIRGITLLGGEPFEPANQPELVKLVERIRRELPGKTIWCYSGYDYEKDILAGKLGDPSITRRLLEGLDVLVDGEFQQENYDIRLKFRGSSNQRIIDVQESLKRGEVVLWESK